MVIQKNGEFKIKMEQIIDETYKKGYNDAINSHHLFTQEEIDEAEQNWEKDIKEHYEQGLVDGWHTAQKIIDMSDEEIESLFKTKFWDQVIYNFPINKVMDIIRKHEKKQTEIECGECDKRWWCEEDIMHCPYTLREYKSLKQKSKECGDCECGDCNNCCTSEGKTPDGWKVQTWNTKE